MQLIPVTSTCKSPGDTGRNTRQMRTWRHVAPSPPGAPAGLSPAHTEPHGTKARFPHLATHGSCFLVPLQGHLLRSLFSTACFFSVSPCLCSIPHFSHSSLWLCLQCPKHPFLTSGDKEFGTCAAGNLQQLFLLLLQRILHQGSSPLLTPPIPFAPTCTDI